MVNMANPLMQETGIWFDKWRYDDAETHYQEHLAKSQSQPQGQESSGILQEIARARQQIQKSLNTDDFKTPTEKVHSKEAGSEKNVPSTDNAVVSRIEALESENKELRKITDDLRQMVKNLENRISSMESGSKAKPSAPVPTRPPPMVAPEADDDDDDDDDDDIDLFGDDNSDDEAAAAKLKEERIAAYAAKKSKKPALIAKSNLILDVKPWDDETDMAVLEKNVRTIVMDGLLWGASKLVPVGYGIKKLQISCVIEDDKVSTDDLEDQIVAFEDYVQSMDIAAFNKV